MALSAMTPFPMSAPLGDAAARGSIAVPEPGAFLAALENAQDAAADLAGKAGLAMPPPPVEAPPPAGGTVTAPNGKPAPLAAEAATATLEAAPVVTEPTERGPATPASTAPAPSLPEMAVSDAAEPVTAETAPSELAEPVSPKPDAVTKDAAAPEFSASAALVPAAGTAVPPPVPQAAGMADATPVRVAEEKLVQRDAKAPEDRDSRVPAKRKAAAAPAPLPIPAQTAPPASTPPASPMAVVVNVEAAPAPAAQELAPEGASKPASPAAAEPVNHGHAGAATPAATDALVDPLPGDAEPAPEPRLSTPLFTQTLEAATARHAASPYASAPEAAVSVREGRFGADIGVTIARALDAGPDGKREDLLIRLDPRHMGRVEVRMSFEHDGVLRAVVSADSPAALDMLRRESADLGRALADAGVRSDGQSLRFDGGGAGGGQRQGARPHGASTPGSDFAGSGTEDPIHRPLRSSGHVDLMA
jgi:flagellar hook-length control protein FliK